MSTMLEFDPANMLREPLSNLNPGETCIMRHPDGKWIGPYEVIRHGAIVKPGLSAEMMHAPKVEDIFMPASECTVIAMTLKEERKGNEMHRVLQYFGVPSKVEVIKIWR